jgi:nucleotide-binding universal stress UspA family protein
MGETRRWPVFTRILVPEDIGEVLMHPLELAAGLARVGSAKVVLLSVIDDSFPNPDILSFQMPWADYYRHLREEAIRRLEQARQEAGLADAEIVVVRGKPAAKIAEFAELEGIDLIVMGMRGRSGVGRALVGSVTRRVLYEAPCPVLVTSASKG